MLIIRNNRDHQDEWTSDVHHAFLKKCELYIDSLRKAGRLIAAQPLSREGAVVSGSPGSLSTVPFDEKENIQVGYYHILADDLEQAIDLAKQNPEFEFGSTASVEVRPIKSKEDSTGFTYPKG